MLLLGSAQPTTLAIRPFGGGFLCGGHPLWQQEELGLGLLFGQHPNLQDVAWREGTLQGHGMAWYGMVWHGMAWYGMGWYGVVSYGMVW